VAPPRRRYPTDLTDAQWALLAPLILWGADILIRHAATW